MMNILVQEIFSREVTILALGHAVAQLLEILLYKPEGRGFDSQWGHWDSSLV